MSEWPKRPNLFVIFTDTEMFNSGNPGKNIELDISGPNR